MRLLLDAHLSPALAEQLRRRGIDAVALRDWRGGNYRTATDEQVLAVAYEDQRVLVTYDCRTVPALLKQWAETGRSHGGVVLVDGRTLRQTDVGGLLRALAALAGGRGEERWQDRAVFLRGPAGGKDDG